MVIILMVILTANIDVLSLTSLNGEKRKPRGRQRFYPTKLHCTRTAAADNLETLHELPLIDVIMTVSERFTTFFRQSPEARVVQSPPP